MYRHKDEALLIIVVFAATLVFAPRMVIANPYTGGYLRSSPLTTSRA